MTARRYARVELAARRLAGAASIRATRLSRRDKAVAVGIGCAGVDRVRQDVVHQGWRPGMAAGARDVGTGVQALEDLTDGRPLVDEPAIKGAHQRRSEERRVGKECRSRWSPHHFKKNG